MRKPEIIIYQGNEIIYLDFTGLKDKEEILKLEGDGSKMIRSHIPKSALTLTNLEGMHFNNDIKKYFEECVVANTPFVKASAVIGLSGLISIFYNGFVKLTRRDVKSFKSKDEALEYLIGKK